MPATQWTLPQRRDYITQLRASGTSLYQYPLKFQGRTQVLPAYRVDIGFPCYRLANGRTRASQLEAIATKGLPIDFFNANPDSESALIEQDHILREVVSQAGLLKIFKKDEQDRPLILDTDGYIVNGNRRVCVMRLLLEQDETKYAHFKRIDVIFLPPCTERDIKELEGRLQVLPEGRAEYSWVDEALIYKDLRVEGWTDDDIAELYEKDRGDIQELLAMLEDADTYLTAKGKPGQYSLVMKKEFAFRQLQKGRRKCNHDEPKKRLFTALAYLMISDKDTAEGRLYDNVPDALKYIDNLAVQLTTELPCPQNTTPENDPGLDLLGASLASPYAVAAGVLTDPTNEQKARDIVRDTLEEMRNKERERKDATYCIRQLQQAYTRLQTVLTALTEDTETSGFEDTLRNIEEAVTDIRGKLGNGQN